MHARVRRVESIVPSLSAENVVFERKLSAAPVRKIGGLLGGLERPLLRYLAQVMPSWASSDLLTAIGFAGAMMTGLGYILTNLNLTYLWLASLGLAVNWFGDSLDGTVARYRGLERPQYGFFLDHMTDVASEVVVALSLGMTAFLHFDVACLGLIVYLAFSVFTFTKAVVSGEFRITFGGFSPTEVRAALIASNTALLWYHPRTVLVLWEPMSAVDLIVLAASLIGVAALVVLSACEARRLAGRYRSQ